MFSRPLSRFSRIAKPFTARFSSQAAPKSSSSVKVAVRLATAAALLATAGVGTIFAYGGEEQTSKKQFRPALSAVSKWLKPGETDYAALAEKQANELPIEQAVLTRAPFLPPPITRKHPVLLKVDLTTEMKQIALTNQYNYNAWTFGDTVPGPFIRARVGDLVELTLKNIDPSGNPHNIDCHGFEGPGGGAAITLVAENEVKTARFKLVYPGLYVYHCAAGPVPAHIMNGMYGLMYIQDEEDRLPKVDKEYYVMQSEFYCEPLEKDAPNRVAEPSYPLGLDEMPTSVVFNGREGSLRDNPLKANAGDKVRVFFGNGGPNFTSSFHIIGAVFTNVFRDGDVTSPPGKYIQTVSVPPGGSTIVDVHPMIPGTYTLVDHAIFRMDKGAVGFLNVSGTPRPDLYVGDQQPIQCPNCKLHP